MKHTPTGYILASIIFCLSWLSPSLFAQDYNEDDLLIDDTIKLVTPDKAELSMLIVRPDTNLPLPVALTFTIYGDEKREKDIARAKYAAQRGYVSVIAYTRGVHLSNSENLPYETEAEDVNVLIDWLAQQSWSDGRVAMYGGSFDGYTQWAATKNPHPALKTIVPYVAVIPGYGLPMENNIFINANYGWAFHVTNGKYKDQSIYQQHHRWRNLNQSWFESGKPYRTLDSFDKRPNPMLHKWLDHPSYDSYWQSLVPFKEEFAEVDIPVLSITGYYDDGQVSAIRYVQEHEKYHPNPNHYLVIGPYDHWTAQGKAGKTLRDITLDPSALIDVPALTVQWLDFILKKGPRPDLLKNRINYQVMGDDKWHSAPSLKVLNDNSQRLFLGTKGELKKVPSTTSSYSRLEIDLNDRKTQNTYYPWPITTEQLPDKNALVFVSPKLQEDQIYAGQFSANLDLKLNRKDVDINLVVYHLTPQGEYFHLSYYIGRASYAKDMTKRQLLTPGIVESVPVRGTRMNAKLLEKGSQIIVVANINKNNFAQVNYGTGKDVSDESFDDALTPLVIDWMHTSYVDLPLQKITQQAGTAN